MTVRGKRVLIFGDSMSHRGAKEASNIVAVTEGVNRRGAPGDLLASHLLAAGAAAARLDARTGRSAYSFFAEPDHAAALAADVAWRPDVVLIFLGTNDMLRDLGKDRPRMERLRDTFAQAGADVWAVGPPTFRPDRRACLETAGGQCLAWSAPLNEVAVPTVAMMVSVFGPARFIDARPLTTDILTVAQGRSGDGVHFGSGSALFAARLARAVLGQNAAVAASARPVDGVSALLATMSPMASVVAQAARGLEGADPGYVSICRRVATIKDVATVVRDTENVLGSAAVRDKQADAVLMGFLGSLHYHLRWLELQPQGLPARSLGSALEVICYTVDEAVKAVQPYIGIEGMPAQWETYLARSEDIPLAPAVAPPAVAAPSRPKALAVAAMAVAAGALGVTLAVAFSPGRGRRALRPAHA